MALNYAFRDPKTRDSTPYLLTSGSSPIFITYYNATGTTDPPVTLATRDLMNTLRNPVEITELHFVVTESFSENALVVGYGQYMGSWEVSLALGSHQITQGFVPVRALEVRRDTDFIEGSITLSPMWAGTMRWIFPKPLIVAPNEGFSGMVRLSPNLVPTDNVDKLCSITMVARGRRLAVGTPVPRKRAIPYASGWIFTVPNQPAPDMIFRNPFNTLLHVSALTCCPVSTGDDVTPSTADGTVTIESPGGLANNVIRSLISNGTVGIFDQRNALEEAHDLNPGESYQVSLSQTTIVPLFVPSQQGANGIAMGILGWREE